MNTTQTHTDDLDEPSSGARRSAETRSFVSRITGLLQNGKSDTSLRETIEEYIDEQNEAENSDPSSQHERLLLSNILKLRDLTVSEVMIPRADIKALEVSTPQPEVLKYFSEIQVSRLPVYKDTLDEVLGTVHLKDVLSKIADNQKVILKDIVTDVPIVSPSMPLMDFLLKVRQTQRHMAMVIDEYGGIDGLVTIGDVIEAILGEIEDEHDREEDHPMMVEANNGHVLADARVELDDFCEAHGNILSKEDHDESDTLGGVVFHLAGRVPARGEILEHKNGMVFEILDADPRRVNRVRIRNIPNKPFEALEDAE